MCRQWVVSRRSAQFQFLQDGGRYFLDRLGRRIQPADSLTTHHLFRFGNFVAAVGQRGVVAVGASFLADPVQALGLDGQAEQFAPLPFEGSR